MRLYRVFLALAILIVMGWLSMAGRVLIVWPHEHPEWAAVRASGERAGHRRTRAARSVITRVFLALCGRSSDPA
jgi:hypothetical protein